MMAITQNPFSMSDYVYRESWERQQMMMRDREEIYRRDQEQEIARVEKKAADIKRTKLLLTTR